eukprot:COSAG03_NODE_2521_length_2678_cov_3.516745_1_plen_616_part_10
MSSSSDEEPLERFSSAQSSAAADGLERISSVLGSERHQRERAEQAELLATEESSALQEAADAIRLQLTSGQGDVGTPARECIICFENKHDGVECDGTPQHFCCTECFQEHVAVSCQDEMRKLQMRDGRVFCPCCVFPPSDESCRSSPYPGSYIARYCDEKTFDLYQEAQGKLMEARIAREADATVRLRVEAELRQAQEQGGELTKARKCILEEILPLSCPRCKQVFIDFEGCMALTCSGADCGCDFCGWCLADCGTDAHAHVAKCPAKPAGADRYFAQRSEYDKVWNRRRKTMLEAYLATKDLPLQTAILNSVRQELADLGLPTTVAEYTLRVERNEASAAHPGGRAAGESLGSVVGTAKVAAGVAAGVTGGVVYGTALGVTALAGSALTGLHESARLAGSTLTRLHAERQAEREAERVERNETSATHPRGRDAGESLGSVVGTGLGGALGVATGALGVAAVGAAGVALGPATVAAAAAAPALTGYLGAEFGAHSGREFFGGVGEGVGNRVTQIEDVAAATAESVSAVGAATREATVQSWNGATVGVASAGHGVATGLSNGVNRLWASTSSVAQLARVESRAEREARERAERSTAKHTADTESVDKELAALQSELA